MKKILFLDLEDTVIDAFHLGWGAKLVKQEVIQELINSEKPDSVEIFSFAISNDRDVGTFNKIFRNWLETAIGRPFDGVFKTEDLFELCKETGTIFENDLECMLFHGKTLGFIQFIRMSPRFNDVEVILVDDAVEDMEIFLPRRNVKIRIISC